MGLAVIDMLYEFRTDFVRILRIVRFGSGAPGERLRRKK